MSYKTKLAFLSLIAIAVLVVSLSVSGCTTPATTTPTSQTAPESTTPATGVTATPAASSGTTTTTTEGVNPWTQAFKRDKLNWYSYTKPGDVKAKIEFASEDHNGQPATKITTYIDGKKTQQSYYDFAGKKFLGGVMYLGGAEMEMGESDFNSLANDVYFSLDDPEDFTYNLKSSADTVTTAKGTFACTKYVTDNGFETFWVSNDAPLPVKYYNKVTDFTWEASEWG